MEFTFPLRRAMIGITILCGVAIIGVNYPWFVLTAGFVCAMFLPAAWISFLMAKFSWRPRMTIATGLIGAVFVALVLSPVVLEAVPGGRPFTEVVSVLTFYKNLYLGFAACAALGAVVAAGIVLRFTGKPLSR